MRRAYTWIEASLLALPLATFGMSCAAQKIPFAAPSVQHRVDSVDAMLAALRPALRGYPPRASSEKERQEVNRQWREAEEELIELGQTFPKSPEIQWRLGELYRFGHNLDVPDAGHKCVSHLERAIALKPDYLNAYLELGIFYTDAGPPWPSLGETNLRKAIELSASTPQPRAWRALVFACYYQGKFTDAVVAADRYLELVPDDEEMGRFRKVAQGAAARGAKGFAPVGRVIIP